MFPLRRLRESILIWHAGVRLFHSGRRRTRRRRGGGGKRKKKQGREIFKQKAAGHLHVEPHLFWILKSLRLKGNKSPQPLRSHKLISPPRLWVFSTKTEPECVFFSWVCLSCLSHPLFLRLREEYFYHAWCENARPIASLPPPPPPPPPPPLSSSLSVSLPPLFAFYTFP